jgi:uncharacterized low-complexity protein
MKKLILSSALVLGAAMAFTGCAQNDVSKKEECKTCKVKKGSCGAGKCGSDMKKGKKGSCGAGKCGGDMKKKKASGSCGAGKCGH